MSSSTKTRHTTRQPPRLRASCDGCFIAKVKCTKNRPVCARCLACGIDCRYSPSSRAGKPRSDANPSGSASGGRQGSTDLPAVSEMVDARAVPDVPDTPDDKTATSPSHHILGLPSFKAEAGWNTPPSSCEGSMSRSLSMSSDLAMLGMETGAAANTVPTYAATTMPWTPPHDITTPCAEIHGMPLCGGRSMSYDVAMAAMGQSWVDSTNQDMFTYGQPSLATSASMVPVYFSSPIATSSAQVPRPKPGTSLGGAGGSCTCFTACLQSLQALHNASCPAAPAFDQVLSLNRKAVEGCATMLNCQRCMSRSGTHTAAMLLATVLGKITSFYRDATDQHFDDSSAAMLASGHGTTGAASPNPTGLGISLGAYQLRGDDGKWLELEILARELRKLEEVYARFRDVCADLSEDSFVSEAMVGYLGRTLESTLAVVHHRKAAIFCP